MTIKKNYNNGNKIGYNIYNDNDNNGNINDKGI